MFQYSMTPMYQLCEQMRFVDVILLHLLLDGILTPEGCGDLCLD